jgi:hypothetical protein
LAFFFIPYYYKYYGVEPLDGTTANAIELAGAIVLFGTIKW